MAGIAAQHQVCEPEGGGGLYGAMFFPLAHGAPLSLLTYERQAQVRHKQAGTFSKLGVYCSANSDTDITHIMLMRNTNLGPALGASGTTGALDAVIPAATTGFFEDITNTDHIDGNQYVTGYRLRTSGSSLLGLLISMVQWTFTSDVDNERCYRLGAVNDSNIDNQADIKFGCMGGISNGSEQAPTTDLPFQLYVPPSGGTLKNAAFKTWSNSCNDDSVLTMRKNGADTALTVTVPAETSGCFEDTDTDVAVVEGDLFNWRISHGPDFGGQYTHETYAVDFITADWFGGATKNGSGNTINLTDDGVAPLCGNHEDASVEAQAAWHATTNENWRGIVVMVPTNSMVDGAVYWRTRINGVDGDQEVTVPFGQTGVFISAGATEDPFVEGDLLTLHRVAVSTSAPTLIYHTHSFFGGPEVTPSASDSSTPPASDSSTPPDTVEECIAAPPTVQCAVGGTSTAGCLAAHTPVEAGCAETFDNTKMTVRLNG